MSWNSGREAVSAGASARANGCSLVSVGPSCAAKPLDLAERLVGLHERPGQQRQSRLEVRGLRGDRGEVRVRGLDQRRQLPVDAAERRGHALEVVDREPQVVAARGEQGGERPRVPVERLEPLERALERRDRGGGILERSRASAEEQQQIAARVGVERGQDLVEIDVGRGAARSQQSAGRHRAGLSRPRVDRQVHVLQRRPRAQQHGRVPVDRRVLLEDVHGHDRPPVLELDASDQPDLDAGDRDRLPLPRRDRRAGRELGSHRVVALPERERRLVVEHVGGDRERAGDERDDRDEVLAVGLECAPHGPTPVVT